jgi:hypothetical protein
MAKPIISEYLSLEEKKHHQDATAPTTSSNFGGLKNHLSDNTLP